MELTAKEHAEKVWKEISQYDVPCEHCPCFSYCERRGLKQIHVQDCAKKAEAERDQAKAQSEDNLMKCPCDTEYDDDHDCEFHRVVRLDRDKWKARAEALEQAVKSGDSLCEFCIHDGKPANWPPCVGCDRDGVGGWEFNEARFKK